MWTEGRTDRHDEANSSFSQFCELVQKWAKPENLPEKNASIEIGAQLDRKVLSLNRSNYRKCI
jgi:hypothetical protein